MRNLFVLPLVLLLLNCSSSKKNQQVEEQNDVEQTISVGGGTTQPAIEEDVAREQAINIEQGIAGRIVWQSGNHMPSPDAPRSSGKKGVERTVYIYELTKGSQVTTVDGVFHAGIQTELVKQVSSDANGYFEVALEPGSYSIFTKEEKGLYANLFDGENNIFPVVVEKGQVTPVEFLINYEATY